MKKSFVMYTTWAADIAKLPDTQAAQLIKAISCYQIGEEYEITDPSVQAIFEAMIVPKFKEDDSKYHNKVESIQNARDRKQPDNNMKPDSKQTENKMESDSKQPVSSSVTDTVTVTVHPSDVEKKDARAKKPARKKYGEYKHVMLPDDEYNRLVSKHGEQETEAAIQKVDKYCEETGKRYQNYSLTIQRWGYSDSSEKARGKPPDKPTSFNGNFHQRDYNYEDLEAQLMRAQGAT